MVDQKDDDSLLEENDDCLTVDGQIELQVLGVGEGVEEDKRLKVD